MGTALVAGTHVTITRDDGDETVTIAATWGSGRTESVDVLASGAAGDGSTA